MSKPPHKFVNARYGVCEMETPAVALLCELNSYLNRGKGTLRIDTQREQPARLIQLPIAPMSLTFA